MESQLACNCLPHLSDLRSMWKTFSVEGTEERRNYGNDELITELQGQEYMSTGFEWKWPMSSKKSSRHRTPPKRTMTKPPRGERLRDDDIASVYCPV